MVIVEVAGIPAVDVTVLIRQVTIIGLVLVLELKDAMQVSVNALVLVTATAMVVLEMVVVEKPDKAN